MSPRWLVLMIFALPMLASGSDAPPRPALNSDLPYQAERSNPVTYDVDFSVVVTAPYHTKKLRVWLPLPQTDAGQEVVEKQFESFPMKVQPCIGTEPVF